MLLPLLVGLVSAVAVLALCLAYLGMPPRSLCPACQRSTEAVCLPAPLRPLQRLMIRRWCPSCGWSGLGRNGPVLCPRKGPVAHTSGFRWNPADLPPEGAFLFGEEGEDPGGDRPVIRLGDAIPAVGFRWREPEAGGEGP